MVGFVFNNWKDVQNDVDNVAENPAVLELWHCELLRVLQPAPTIRMGVAFFGGEIEVEITWGRRIEAQMRWGWV